MSEKPSYWQLLQDPRWQKKRLEVLEAGHWRCSHCCSGLNDGKQFHAHHRYYVKDRLPWDYPDFAYEALCDDCHKKEHSDPSVMAGWEKLMEVLTARTGSGIGFESIARHFEELRGKPDNTSFLASLFLFVMQYKDEMREHHREAIAFNDYQARCDDAITAREKAIGRKLTEDEEFAFIQAFK